MRSQYKLNFSIVILCIILFQNCNNELDLNYNSEVLPVVFCLLDQNSEHQYLRLGKTYTGQAEYNNQIPPADSLLLPGYRDIYVEEWIDNDINAIHYFAIDDGVQKDTGLFPADAIAVYRSDFKPKPETKYTLYIFFPHQNRVISGETSIMGHTELIDPAPIHVREINFMEGRGYTLRYITAPNAGIYQGVFTIYYSEASGDDLQFNSFEIILPIKYINDSYFWVSQSISSGTFFNGFVNHVSIKPNVERELIHLDFTLFGAGEDLSYFVKAQLPTFWMNLSQYTNLDNGFGVFSNISESSVSNLQFSVLTKHHLATDTLTRDLNFNDPLK